MQEIVILDTNPIQDTMTKKFHSSLFLLQIFLIYSKYV